MNSLIKDTDNYVRRLPAKTEIFNFTANPGKCKFWWKNQDVIPQLTSKDYYKAHPKKAQL